MAEKLCTLRTKGGGGGKYTETSLWTNSAPTSSFANTTVTLSQSIDNFKYIGIKHKPTTTSSDTDMTIMLVSDVKKSLVGASDINLLIGNTDSAGSFVRRVFYISSTQIRIDAAYRINTAGNNNANTIPLEILGLNELDHGKNFDETTLWTNANPTSSFATQTVSLSEPMDSFDYIKVIYRLSTSNSASQSALYSVSEFKLTSIVSPNLYDVIGGRITDFYDRYICYNAGGVRFGEGRQSGGAATNNNNIIPTSIVGCKFR